MTLIFDLINQSKKEITRAQSQIVKLLHGQMTFLCRRYVNQHEDAEECLSDGFCNVFTGIAGHDYISDDAFVGWVNKIMVNVCLRFLEKKNTFLIIGEEEAIDIPIQEIALAHLSTSEIFNLVANLPVGYKTVFNMHVIEGYSHEKIASSLKISEGTSKSQLSRAKQLLQKMLISNQDFYGKQQSK